MKNETLDSRPWYQLFSTCFTDFVEQIRLEVELLREEFPDGKQTAPVRPATRFAPAAQTSRSLT